MGCFRIRAEILPNPDSFLIPITLLVCIGITEVAGGSAREGKLPSGLGLFCGMLRYPPRVFIRRDDGGLRSKPQAGVCPSGNESLNANQTTGQLLGRRFIPGAGFA
jgi:hypothetical protein